MSWPALWQSSPRIQYDDTEAARYDDTRGGFARAKAAAEAVHSLLPWTAAGSSTEVPAGGGQRVLELAVGTGIVGAELVALGNLVHGVDLSESMLQRARIRLPGHVAAADAGRLPVADRRCDAVVAIWLLHLLEDSSAVIAEVARVLRPDGVFITTTEKSDSSRYADGRGPNDTRSQDALSLLVAQAARHGLTLDGATTFPGPPRNTNESPLYPLVRFRRT
nr:class I SAM-dependent methyltransferase [Kribbella antiqua]